jgi:signal recognition particle receptor subunit beta
VIGGLIAHLAQARRELAGILEADELAGVDVLILANKMDMPGAVGPEKLAKVLDLETTASGHEWYVQASCAQTGVGLYEGLSWLVDRMRQTRTPPLSFD